LEFSSEKVCKENHNIQLICYIHFSENHNICEVITRSTDVGDQRNQRYVFYLKMLQLIVEFTLQQAIKAQGVLDRGMYWLVYPQERNPLLFFVGDLMSLGAGLDR